MTITKYGVTAEEKWVTIEDRLRAAATRLPREEHEEGFWPAVKALADGRMHDVQPVYLTQAVVDIEGDDSYLEIGDLGYRLVPHQTKVGIVLVIEVMHDNSGRDGEPPVLGNKGQPLPFTTTKAWACMPDSESEALEFLAEIRAAYRALNQYGDRGQIQSSEQREERRHEQEQTELAEAGLDFLTDMPEAQIEVAAEDRVDESGVF